MLINLNKQLDEIKAIMRPGDAIVVQGVDLLSLYIGAKSKSIIHHAAIIINNNGELGAIMAGGKMGVAFKKIEDIINVSPFFIRMWILRLKDSFNVVTFNNYAVNQIGKLYDYSQALTMLFGNPGKIMENTYKMFCSELVAACWKEAGIIPDTTNVSRVAPVDIAEWNLYEDNYYQIRGLTKEIDDYNTREIGTYKI